MRPIRRMRGFAAALGVLALAGACSDGLTNAQRIAQADEETKRLLLLMDRDQDGKVSRREFLDYMTAEFDRLDVNHSGDLDPVELNQLHVRWHPVSR